MILFLTLSQVPGRNFYYSKNRRGYYPRDWVAQTGKSHTKWYFWVATLQLRARDRTFNPGTLSEEGSWGKGKDCFASVTG